MESNKHGGCIAVHRLTQCKGDRFVVGVDGEGAFFQHVAEVTYAGNAGFLLKALYLICAGSSFFEKKASGCHAANREDRCCRAAMTWSAEASTINANSWSCCGCASRGAAPKADRAVSKAVSINSVHSTAAVALGLPRVELVSGRRIFAAAGTNLL